MNYHPPWRAHSNPNGENGDATASQATRWSVTQYCARDTERKRLSARRRQTRTAIPVSSPGGISEQQVCD
ncbi:hypothetical protein KCP78_18880 [Salmonella enterica subsp. enterica]|nr:hypothetical protein KCP78_18880 [Salmonella enterica subsp. enterica]